MRRPGTGRRRRVLGRGGVAARVACDLAGRVASVAVVAGALYSEPGECKPSRVAQVASQAGTGGMGSGHSTVGVRPP